jgi:uroporphyrinogen-III decarboxylase
VARDPQRNIVNPRGSAGPAPPTPRQRVLRVLEGGNPDRPPLHLSFRASGDGTVPAWARDWPIRAGVDVIEVEIDAEWPAVGRSIPDCCRALLDAPWPDPSDPSLYRTLGRIARAHPDRALFLRTPGIFQQLDHSLGFHRFLKAVEQTPGLAGQVMERFVTHGATVMAEAVARGAIALLLVEPLAASDGVLRASLEELEQWVFPFDRLLLEGAVRDGAPLLVECPQAGEGLWEQFRGVGARLIGPVPPSTLEWLVEQRRGVWEELGLYGALDVTVIARGTPDEIRDHVAAMFGLAGRRRSLIFSAADVPTTTPMGNLEALLEAVEACRY